MNISSIISNIQKDRVDTGLLIIRILIGASMAFLHGYGKLTGGPEMWAKVGGAMSNFGITFAPAFWGFLAMFAEFFCSLAIMLGIFFRPAAALLIITMIVAAVNHLSLPADNPRGGISGASHALEFMAVYIGLFLTGPGKYRLSALWKRSDKNA